MEILLIGNGFDLEHDLPTTYSDFLDFCKKLQYVFEATPAFYLDAQKQFPKWKTSESIKETLLAALRRRTFHDAAKAPEDDLFDELHDCLEDNLWINYFQKAQPPIGKNWIDFESEISRVIQALDAARLLLLNGKPLALMEKEAHTLLNSFCKNAKVSLNDITQTTASLDQLTQRLSADLDRLIRAFEIYIAGFIDREGDHQTGTCVCRSK